MQGAGWYRSLVGVPVLRLHRTSARARCHGRLLKVERPLGGQARLFGFVDRLLANRRGRPGSRSFSRLLFDYLAPFHVSIFATSR